MKKSIIILIVVPFVFGNSGCSDADIASHNLSKSADNFEIMRRFT